MSRFAKGGFILAVVVSLSAFGANAPHLQGSALITPEVGMCIHPTDHIKIRLRKLIIPKTSRFLGLVQDQAAAFYINTSLTGGNGDNNKKVSFSTVNQQSMSAYGNGVVAFPIEQAVLSDFPLSTGSTRFTEISLEFSVVKTTGKSQAATVLLGAVGATKNLTLPANPLSGALDIASTYVNAFLDPLVEKANKNGEAQPSAKFALGISSSGTCDVDDAKTGTRAVIFAVDDLSQPNTADIAKQYCWRVDTTPQWMLEFAQMPANQKCDGVTGFAPLANPYAMFYVSAFGQGHAQPPLGLSITTYKADKSLQSFTPAVARRASHSFHTDMANARSIAEGILSNESAQEVASSFSLSDRDILTFRDAVKRCSELGIAPATCM
jgi:hypothetical protein